MSLRRCWVPPGQGVTIAGHDIPGGLFYHGRHLPGDSPDGEPELIDPDLPVDPAGLFDPAEVDPTSSYRRLSPAARWAYLGWLAGGRRARPVPRGFVRLFLFGLEHRVLVDMGQDSDACGELPAIMAEARRMLAGHIGVSGLAGPITALLDLAELLSAARGRPGEPIRFAPPPRPGGDRNSVPMALRIAIARSAVTRTPVPADWAASWLWYHPDLPPLTPQQRCQAEFWRLFAPRYARAHGAGLVPRAAGVPVRVVYQPEHPGLVATVVERPDLPEALTDPAATRALGRLRDEVARLLDPYSRWLARCPEGGNTLAATALLPAELVDREAGPLGHLRAWATASLDGRARAVIGTADLHVFWLSADAARMTREEAAGLATVLALIGLGVEPDARFCGPSLTSGPAVLFTLPEGTSGQQSPRHGYAAAATAVDLAAWLLSAGGFDDPEDQQVNRIVERTVAEIATVLGWATVDGATASGATAGRDAAGAVSANMVDSPVTGADLARLSARLLWRLAAGATGSGRVTGLAGDRAATRAGDRNATRAGDRAAVGRFLITVAADVVHATPPVVKALAMAYEALGIDPVVGYRRLHAAGAGGRRDGDESMAGTEMGPGAGPVTVRPAGQGSSARALPWAVPTADTGGRQPGAAADTSARQSPASADTSGPASGTIRLDRAIVERRMAETEDVSGLLAEIFAEDGDVTGWPTGQTSGHRLSQADIPLLAGLDMAHSALLRALASRLSWTRQQFAALAAEYQVMPDGALDLINEVAIEITGEPVIDEDDELTVNEHALRELLT